MDSDFNVLLVCRYESLEGDSVSIGAWENMHRYANLLTLRSTDTSSQSEAESIYRKLISGREKFFGCVVCMYIHMFVCILFVAITSPASTAILEKCLPIVELALQNIFIGFSAFGCIQWQHFFGNGGSPEYWPLNFLEKIFDEIVCGQYPWGAVVSRNNSIFHNDQIRKCRYRRTKVPVQQKILHFRNTI